MENPIDTTTEEPVSEDDDEVVDLDEQGETKDTDDYFDDAQVVDVTDNTTDEDDIVPPSNPAHVQTLVRPAGSSASEKPGRDCEKQPTTSSKRPLPKAITSTPKTQRRTSRKEDEERFVLKAVRCVKTCLLVRV
jgi:hypothetical protein